MLGTLYKIVNQINNKVYIGKTYTSLEKRFKDHMYDATRYPNRPLYLAFNKYGIENFTIESIGTFPNGELEEAEQKAIIQYNSYGENGYNATFGGDNNRRTIVNEEKIIEKYHQLKSMVAVARKYRIGDDLVRKILLSNNIPIYNAIGKHRKKPVKIIELNIEFESIIDCANYLVSNKITACQDVKSVSNKINRALKNNKPYYGLQIQRLNPARG